MMARPFRQVDVFTETPYLGNPVAVVHDAVDLSDEQMARFARWTNLSETTFLLPPTSREADYRVRIFTPTTELPFAGHPTLGTCHAWLEAGGRPHDGDERIVQECAAGLIPLRRTDAGLAFRSPPLIRSGPVDEATVAEIARDLRVDRSEILEAQYADNGPPWIAVLLPDADAVVALTPGYSERDIGVLGFYPPGAPAAIEVRAFFPKDGVTTEDPVTGSLNAALAEWLVRSGRLAAPYIASQGQVLGREGRVQISQDADGSLWVGGATVTCIEGSVEL
jgi:PhzF family phenazine biosynthesis protein